MVGDVLADYRLEALLGEGGMARVYRATHVSTGAQVALKVLSADRSQSTVASRNFALEAEAVERIGHAGIVRISEHIDTHPTYKLHVMELLEGGTLRSVMDGAGEMPVERVLNVAGKVASALAATHDAGYIHRDVKPENVMVGAGDRVTLIDFGAARLAHDKVTSGEPIVGTPLYMAPEQMWGQGSTAKTDVYAFGLMLYEMLAGTLPFKARKFVELREERSTQEPTPLRVTLSDKVRLARATKVHAMKREVPAALEALVMQCLSRDPAERPESMAEVAGRLAALRLTSRTRLRLVSANAKRKTPHAIPWRTAVSYAAAAVVLFMHTSGG